MCGAELHQLPEGVQRVARALQDQDHPHSPVMLDDAARTAQPPVTLIDRELFRFDEIWAAAGHPHGVFKLRPQDLEHLTGAPVADVVLGS